MKIDKDSLRQNGRASLKMTGQHKPTRQGLLAAAGKTVPDVIAPGLRVLFCGINPGLYSAATGHHFARHGNRFWPALHRAGVTDRLLAPDKERELLKRGYGIANVVARATATAAELSREKFVEGGRLLARKVKRYKVGGRGGLTLRAKTAAKTRRAVRLARLLLQ